MIKINRSFVEISKNHRPIVSLFCSVSSFRLRIYHKGYVKYTLILWDKYAAHDRGLWKGHKRII